MLIDSLKLEYPIGIVWNQRCGTKVFTYLSLDRTLSIVCMVNTFGKIKLSINHKGYLLNVENSAITIDMIKDFIENPL